MKAEELRKEAMSIMEKLFPPEQWGENEDCERLEQIIKELSSTESKEGKFMCSEHSNTFYDCEQCGCPKCNSESKP